MDGIDSNGATTRRLPPWMLGVTSFEKGRGGENGDDNRVVDDGGGCREEGQKVKNRGVRRQKSKVAVAVQERRNEFSDGLELEQGCEDSFSSALVVKSRDRKRKKRKLNLNTEEASRTKRKNQRSRANRNLQSSEDRVTGCCSVDDDDDEDEDFLTVEDLMIFAKECLQGDDNTIEKAELTKQDEFVVDTTIVQSANSIDVHENKRKSETEYITNSSSTSGITMKNVNVSMSGDHPTQDMLDLLLGPLLKKAQEKRKEIDLTNDIDIINFEMKRQEEQTMVAAAGQEQSTPIVTVNKKKTSLKDQVAMFLD